MTVDFDQQGQKVLSPSKLAHVVLRTNTTNFRRMVDFYKTFLGAYATYENDSLAFLTYDDEHHRVAILGLPDPSDTTPTVRSPTGLEHIAFTFDSLTDLALSYRQRKARGISPFWCINHGPTTSIYYKDPDGNKIETQVDNFDTAEAANEFMMSDMFAQNPFGTDFDPEELIERLRRGEKEEEIKKRVEIGPRGIPTLQ
jgi:catechol-2,3-dioxygenase